MEKPADFRLGQTLYFGVGILEMRRCTVSYFGLGSREDRSPPPQPAGPGPALRPAAGSRLAHLAASTVFTEWFHRLQARDSI